MLFGVSVYMGRVTSTVVNAPPTGRGANDVLLYVFPDNTEMHAHLVGLAYRGRKVDADAETPR